MAIDWPQLDELKQVLDLGDTEAWDGDATSGDSLTRLSRLLAAAIDRVKLDVGDWDEDVDEPDEALSQAALRMAIKMAERPELTNGVQLVIDPVYQSLLYGHRRSFGIA
jgi:hypothetical protein